MIKNRDKWLDYWPIIHKLSIFTPPEAKKANIILFILNIFAIFAAYIDRKACESLQCQFS